VTSKFRVRKSVESNEERAGYSLFSIENWPTKEINISPIEDKTMLLVKMGCIFEELVRNSTEEYERSW
jgi:hypothetical protein